MTNSEKVKHIRHITLSPIIKIKFALEATDGDIDKAIAKLVVDKQVDATDMANRVTATNIVYSYVHNHKIGAMIVLACQTDFVAKNQAFLDLAKDICMHIVSTPITPKYVSEDTIPASDELDFDMGMDIDIKKPVEIVKKIIEGKKQKWISEVCLLNQKFVKDDKKTIQTLIYEFASTVGEKIEVKKFVRVIA